MSNQQLMSPGLKMSLATTQLHRHSLKNKRYQMPNSIMKDFLSLTQFWIMTKKRYVTTIYIVRHGESESNVYAREHPEKPASLFGEFGSSLTQKGHDQAQKLAHRLKNVHISAVLSSDLNRAKETAEIIALGHNLSVLPSRTIRERFFGEHMSATKKREIEKAL